MAFMHQFRKEKSIANRSKKYLEEVLHRRLYKYGDSDTSVQKQLNVFLRSKKLVYKWEVDDTLKILRKHNQFNHALKLSGCMAKRGMNKTISDQAIHLDLVAKARGISAAETYFVALPETSKNILTYGALLNCYCKEALTEKAEALMEKMKELNLGLTAMSYNSVMTLYTKTGQPERIPYIIQEMKSGDIMPDSYTYNVWMRALAAVNDISGVERVIDEMTRDDRVAADWTTYSNLASIYVDAGQHAKADKALQELEKKNSCKDLSAFQFLITLYGRTGNLLEVYRVWSSLKLAFRRTANISYLNMIQVLVKLKDLEGAEKCFSDWLSHRPKYDIRIANVLIGAYVNEGLLDKAKELKELSEKKGAKPNAKTWEIFSNYYLKEGDIRSAVDCVENAISIGRRDGTKWAPQIEIIPRLMGHFEQNKDVESAEKFVEILKKAVDKVGADVFESLIRTYVAAGRTNALLRRRIKMEKVDLSVEGTKLLDAVCSD